MASSIRVGKILTNTIKSANGVSAITSDSLGNLNIPNIQGNVSFTKTEIWSNATRPTPVEGIFGYNTTSGYLEIYTNGQWKNINDFAPQNFVTQNLRLHLDPSNPASYPGTGSTWYDLSGNGYDCTLQNGPSYRGYSFYFNGTTQNAVVPPAAIPSGAEMTVEQWILGETNKSSTSFEARDSSNIRTLNLHLTWSNANVYWDSGGGSTYDRINKGVSNSSEYWGWHHWIFTKNTNTGQMKIYLDGELWHSGTGKTITIATSTAARIGSYYNNSTYHQGNIGITRLYNRELSDAEVLRNYNSSKYLYVGGGLG